MLWQSPALHPPSLSYCTMLHSVVGSLTSKWKLYNINVRGREAFTVYIYILSTDVHRYPCTQRELQKTISQPISTEHQRNQKWLSGFGGGVQLADLDTSPSLPPLPSHGGVTLD